MAKYTEFGLGIGAGGSFNLKNYYLLCDEIVKALKEHPTLLEKHFNKLTDKCYYDESLHLLAFDLIYCCNTYGYYRGLVAPLTGKTIRKQQKNEQFQEQAAKAEEERKARIFSLEKELTELEQSIRDFVDISLLGVEVTSGKYGKGTVISQEINRITVQFPGIRKAFILDQKYVARPHFEDDEEIIVTFTEYGRAHEKIKAIQKELDVLQT